MLTTVADDEAIGYVSLGSLNDTVKAVKIDGAEATEQTHKRWKYKICRPFNIATKENADNELAKDFITYIMSTEGQQIIQITDISEMIRCRSLCRNKTIRKSCSRWIFFCITGYGKTDREAYKKVNTKQTIELQTDRLYNRYDISDRRKL